MPPRDMPPKPSAKGAAAALALTSKKRAGTAKISKAAMKQSDPVLVKREQLQQEHDRLMSLMARTWGPAVRELRPARQSRHSAAQQHGTGVDGLV
jgi:hypothetical protein